METPGLVYTNSRPLDDVDKIFAINNKAKKMIEKIGAENVANATIGALMDDSGNLVVLSSVWETLKSLNATDFAEYAPITGLSEYHKSVIQSVFWEKIPDCYLPSIATPGGTGAIHIAIRNYSKKGDIILTSDWYWSPYKTICSELERKLQTYQLFDEDNNFNVKSFSDEIEKISATQDRIFLIINTPAHNPTGYSITDSDWDYILDVLLSAEKDVILLVDAAYIDFAGDPEKCRLFLKKLEYLPTNFLPLISFSMSKSFTLYGMRTGALICMTKDQSVAYEFERAMAFSNRGIWSNCTRPGMEVLIKIYEDPVLLDRVLKERESAQKILLDRGTAFINSAKAENVPVYPYDSGFFAVVKSENPNFVSVKLQEKGVFCVPIDKGGLRISLASTNEKWCNIIPKKIKEVMNE